MRHGDKINNLGRTESHRRALLANLAIALIEHKRITTTLAKAKALRRYVEPLITKGKNNSTHSRRVVFSYLQNKEAITELFGPIAEKIGDRPGGYVRIIKLGFRRGDGAETAMIELVDFNESYNPNAGKVRQAKKTRRGGSKKVAADATTEEPTAPIVEEEAFTEEQEMEAAEAVAEVEAPVEEMVSEVEESVEEVVAAPVEEAVAEVEETLEAVTEEAADVVEAVEETEADAPATEDGSEEKKDEEQA